MFARPSSRRKSMPGPSNEREEFTLTSHKDGNDGCHQVSNDPFRRCALGPCAMKVRVRSLARRVTPCVRSHPSEIEEVTLLSSSQQFRSGEIGIADYFTEGHITVEQQLGVIGTRLHCEQFIARQPVAFHRLRQLHCYLVQTADGPHRWYLLGRGYWADVTLR